MGGSLHLIVFTNTFLESEYTGNKLLLIKANMHNGNEGDESGQQIAL